MDETSSTQHVVVYFRCRLFANIHTHTDWERDTHDIIRNTYNRSIRTLARAHTHTHFIKHLSWRNFAHSLCASIGFCCYLWSRIQHYMLTPVSCSLACLLKGSLRWWPKCHYFATHTHTHSRCCCFFVRMCLLKRLLAYFRPNAYFHKI